MRLNLGAIDHEQAGPLLRDKLANRPRRCEVGTIQIRDQLWVNPLTGLGHGDNLINPQLGEGQV